MVEARAATLPGSGEAASEPAGYVPNNIEPPKVFPPAVQRLLDETAEAYSVPAGIPVAALLALLSCLVGRSRALSAKRGWPEHGNIWIVVVAPSGMGKTPVMSAYFRPIAEREYRLFLEWRKSAEQYLRDSMDFNRKKPDERGEAPKKPKRPQYFLDDSTLEAIGDALVDNPKGILWLVDEMSGMLSSFDRYSAGGKEGSTRARLLSSYDCKSWKTNRKDEGKNVFIPSACLSIFGGLQPAMLARSFNLEDADVGFLPRFMFICAERERPALWTEAVLSEESESLLRRVVNHLSEFCLVQSESGEMVSPVVRLSPEAKARFVEWYDRQARESWEQLSAGMVDALSQKLKGHALRLCLLLHCLDAALAGTDGFNDVPGSTMERALLLVDWVKENQLKALALFKGTEPQRTPVEQAVMAAVLSEAETLGQESFTLTNARLVELVNGLLPEKVRPEQVGRAATKVGLAVAYVGNDRGRRVTADRVELYKTTVGTVGTVGTFTAPTVYSHRQYGNEPSVPSVGKGNADSSTDSTDSRKTNCRYPESLEHQGLPTAPTVPTVGFTEDEDLNALLDRGDS